MRMVKRPANESIQGGDDIKISVRQIESNSKAGKRRFTQILLKVEYVKPRFGNSYWKIDTNATELSKLKHKMHSD